MRSSAALVALGVVVAGLAFGEDPVSALGKRVAQGSVRLPYEGPYGYLRGLLDALHVPVESQIAVFSKTSIQSMRIAPDNPRVVYFNDAVSVAWMRGGFIELAAQDPGKGINYYILEQRPNEQLTRRDDCLRCHQAGATLVRSVVSAPDGIPSREADVDDRTPFSKLWGGWYVTGKSVPAGHMGNAVDSHSQRREIAPVLDSRVALTPASDIVALMVFAHQMRMMNLLARPDNVNELVDELLFVDEAPLRAPIRGGSGFAEKFSAAGGLLRQFDLEHRLMRYPCSYMIYSEAFDGLPGATREAIYRRMSSILTGDDTDARYRHLSAADRAAIVAILRDTKPGVPEWFGRTASTKNHWATDSHR